MLETGKILFEPRQETKAKIQSACSSILEAASCTSAEASKLRGLAGWCAGDTFARAGRLGLAPLKRRQYEETDPTELTAELKEALNFLIEVMPRLRPREACLLGARPPTGAGLLRCELAGAFP